MKDIKLKIDSESPVPKYLQIVNVLSNLIKKGSLEVGDALPSVRKICTDYNLSQETVIKSYGELKRIGAIKSELRKGYFVASNKINFNKNIFLLFDELSEYKKILYNSIREGLDPDVAKIEMFFHHCNAELFKTLIKNNINSYNIFVIMPFKDDKIVPVLANLKNRNVLFLDRKEHIDETHCNFISQDFNNSVFECLHSAVELIRKYEKFILVFPNVASISSNAAKAPKEIKLGFERFCRQNAIEFEIVDEVITVNKNEAFFVIDDSDLVSIVSQSKKNGYQLGKEVGLLSYNDSPIKEVISDGITVISTDFGQLGQEVVKYILEEPATIRKIVETKLIIRNSL
jgi:DNA-binding transcriptional regulator YhcF (GntR family)